MFPIPPIFIFIVISILAGLRVGFAGEKVVGVGDVDKLGASDNTDEGLPESTLNDGGKLLEGALLGLEGFTLGGSLRPVTS